MPGFDERSHEALLRQIDGGVEILPFLADVQVAMVGQLNQHVATISSVTLTHVELNLDSIQVVRIGVFLDCANYVLLNVFADRVGEVEMSGG
jgi:hypothetical protein